MSAPVFTSCWPGSTQSFRSACGTRHSVGPRSTSLESRTCALLVTPLTPGWTTQPRLGMTAELSVMTLKVNTSTKMVVFQRFAHERHRVVRTSHQTRYPGQLWRPWWLSPSTGVASTTSLTSGCSSPSWIASSRREASTASSNWL